jgi:hypothetical protein
MQEHDAPPGIAELTAAATVQLSRRLHLLFEWAHSSCNG